MTSVLSKATQVDSIQVDSIGTVIQPLTEGEHLDQGAFHLRYQFMPEEIHAELVGGVVHLMPSPVKYTHGKPLSIVLWWLGDYEAASPGTEALSEVTLILGPRSEPQPDAFLRILPSFGGQTEVDEEGYLTGTPELLVEVAISTASFDLNERKQDYEKTGIREYVVVLLNRVEWFVLEDGKYQPVSPDENEIFRSVHFPGLWLDSQALLAGNRKLLRQVVRQGMASPEHRGWVKKMRASHRDTRRRKGRGSG